MRGIVDYAGMFPPAKLSIGDAVVNFSRYHLHQYSDFLGNFILPIDHLTEDADLPSKISGLVHSAELSRRNFPTIRAESIEVDLPVENYDSAGDFLSKLESIFPGEGRIFVELDWRKSYGAPMSAIARVDGRFGVKLRTGGVTPESIPPAATVADFLLCAAAHKLPLKATAGLHGPVPYDDPDVGARMHGFLNFFSAGFLAFSQHGDGRSLENVLANFGYDDFSFGADSMRCGPVEFSSEQIGRLRSEFLLSFGSCSFLDPVEHLERHGFLK